EDVAAEHLGLQITRGRIDYLLNKLYHPRHDRGLLAYRGTPELLRQVEAARFAADQFFRNLLAWHLRQPRGTGRVRTPGIVPDPVSEELVKLASGLNQLADKLESEEEKIEFTAASGRCAELALSVRQWLAQALADQVYWIEVSGERQQRVTLASAPIEVGPALRDQLYAKVPTVVMTSATLSIGGRSGFEHFQQRLGLTDCATLQLGSPFN